MTAAPPSRWYAVTYEHAVGYDAPRDRRTKTMKFKTAEHAGNQIALIRAHPRHMVLLAVHVSGEIDWTEIDPDSLPIPNVIEFGDDVVRLEREDDTDADDE